MGRQQKILEITKRLVCATGVFILVLKPICANAQDEETRFSSVMKFAGGITAGFLVHEAGHAFAALVTDTDMNWEFGDINQPLSLLKMPTAMQRDLLSMRPALYPRQQQRRPSYGWTR